MLRGAAPSLIGHYAASRPCFLICDLQSAFKTAIPNFNQGCFVAKRFLDFSRVAAIAPHVLTIGTEQSPTKLGELDPRIGCPRDVVLPKTLFSMITPEVEPLIRDRECFVLMGIESHVCILQTVESLIARNKKVWIAADGTWSQRDADREHAMNLMAGMGASISTSESLLLQLVRDAADPAFRDTSRLLKQKAADFGGESDAAAGGGAAA